MKPTRLGYVLATVVLLAGLRGEVRAAEPTTSPVGQICPSPAHPCPGFKPHDLSFVLPHDGVARTEVRSDAFYAVILRSAPKCSIPESARVLAQSRFPGRKVFSQRFECDPEDNVTYTNVAANTAFLAVYAGATRAQAAAVLRSAARRYPGAYLRRMQVVFVYT